MPGKIQTEILSVDISENTTQWLYGLQLVSNLQGAEISRMPNFVTIPEDPWQFRVDESVGVRKQADSGHKAIKIQKTTHRPCYFAPNPARGSKTCEIIAKTFY